MQIPSFVVLLMSETLIFFYKIQLITWCHLFHVYQSIMAVNIVLHIIY